MGSPSRHDDDTSRCVVCAARCASHWPGSVRCASCGVVKKEPFPSAAELDALYAKSWGDPAQHSSETGNTDQLLASEMVENLTKHLGTPLTSQRVLDYGAGQGGFSRALAEAGACVQAFEPYGVELVRTAGINATDNLTQVDGPFDGIAAIEVVEHLRRPSEFAEWVHKQLRPDGWLFLTTPNVCGLNARLHKDSWREFTKAGHIVLFTPGALEELLQRAGFSRIDRVRWPIGHETILQRLKASALLATGAHGALRVVARK